MMSASDRPGRLGSAKEGVRHWRVQRVSAVALVPLLLWFIAGLIGHLGAPYAVAAAWVRQPFPACAMVLLVLAGFIHLALGVQVVIEDYVHREGIKLAAIVALQLACWALAVAAIVAIARIALGAG